MPALPQRGCDFSLLLPMPLLWLVHWFWLGVPNTARVPGDSVGHPGAWGCHFAFRAFSGFAAVAAGHRPLMFLMIHTTTITTTKSLSPLTLGKYRIAACPRPLPCGRFAAQVSIASGRGSASTTRVMRFVDDFSTHDAAAKYAVAQGIDWVNDTLRIQARPNVAAQMPSPQICI